MNSQDSPDEQKEQTLSFESLERVLMQREEPSPAEHLSNLINIQPPTENLAGPSPLLAMYCLWSDDDWIESSLTSIYPFVRKIVCLFNSHPWAGVGLVDPLTEYLVRQFPDPENKILIIKGDWDDPKWGGQLLQRSVGFEICNAENIPWLFLVDGDEIYTTQSMYSIIDWAHVTDKDTGRVPCISFWQDLTQVAWQEHMARLFRVKPGAYFSRPNTVSYATVDNEKGEVK